MDDEKILKMIFDYFGLENKSDNEDIKIVELAFETEVQKIIDNLAPKLSNDNSIKSDFISLSPFNSSFFNKSKDTQNIKASSIIKEEINLGKIKTGINKRILNKNKLNSLTYHHLLREIYLIAFNLISNLLILPSNFVLNKIHINIYFPFLVF